MKTTFPRLGDVAGCDGGGSRRITPELRVLRARRAVRQRGLPQPVSDENYVEVPRLVPGSWSDGSAYLPRQATAMPHYGIDVRGGGRVVRVVSQGRRAHRISASGGRHVARAVHLGR
jgi:hypothetical protein